MHVCFSEGQGRGWVFDVSCLRAVITTAPCCCRWCWNGLNQFSSLSDSCFCRRTWPLARQGVLGLLISPRFIALFTRLLWLPSWATWIRYTSLHPVYWKSAFILPYLYTQGYPKCLSLFFGYNSVWICHFIHLRSSCLRCGFYLSSC